ncbi:MAG: DegT/DnrJ/EryC1/StrS family aminotransferase [Acidobacteriota bacterium]
MSAKVAVSTIPFLDLSFQSRQVRPEFLAAADELVAANRFIGGQAVSGFERDFADFCGVEHCVALNSGTDALRLALMAAGVQPDDEIITSPFTFIATGEAINQVARLVLADVDPETFNLSPKAVEHQVTRRTGAVVPVHIFGLPADMDRINAVAAARGLVVIEDACQAHGASIRGRMTGRLGNAAAFSFYPSKNLGAFGDAGAVTSSDGTIAEKVRLLRNHGQTELYTHIIEGFNSRMDALQARLLSLKLAHLEAWNAERRRLVDVYREELAGIDAIRFQRVPDGYRHAYHILAVLFEERDDLVAYLKERGIDIRVIYPTPLHLMEAYRNLGLSRGDFPNAERVCDEVLCLPLFPGLARESVVRVAQEIRRFFGSR